MQDADLIVLEFSANDKKDAPYTDPERRGYEQLVRKLLQLPGRWVCWQCVVGWFAEQVHGYWPAAGSVPCAGAHAQPVVCRHGRFVRMSRARAHSTAPMRMVACLSTKSLLDRASTVCRPALIQLHHYAWWHAVGDGVEDGGLFYQPAGEAQLGVFASVRHECCLGCGPSWEGDAIALLWM